MLHRSFKPAKCKTSLKLAVSRIKLLKNKKEAQLRQLKRDVAHLLESGQDKTARIRVEHVVREEKMMAAYDLVEIYCELIAARLPVIESQKNCPIDLKEAITSVVFASPRCADIPELLDVRKHFTSKYGKEFVNSALELRPECGVSRQLVEKLSAVAPDGKTKIKILSAIAEEHNVKWDPNSFEEEESKPPADLLNGPNTFLQASKPHVEPLDVRAQPIRDQKHDVPLDLYEQNKRENSFASPDITDKTRTPPTSVPDARPSGPGAQGMDFNNSFSRKGNSFPLDRQNWSMEFKDATSAAQAAAESAERASMAARAAAELSRQHSMESQKSSTYSLRHEEHRMHAGLKGQDGHFSDKSAGLKGQDGHFADKAVNNTFYHKIASTQNAQDDRSNRSASLNSRRPSLDDRSVAESSKPEYEESAESHKSSSYGLRPEEDRIYAASKGQDSHSADKSVNDPFYDKIPSIPNAQDERSSRSASLNCRRASSDDNIFAESLEPEYEESAAMKQKISMQDDSKIESTSYFGEGRVEIQSSPVSSRSHSSASGDDYDVFSNTYHQKDENSAKQISDDIAPAVFDNYAAYDQDKLPMDDESDKRASSLYFPSPGRNGPSLFSSNTNAWSPKGTSSSESRFFREFNDPPVFSESMSKSAVPSQSNDLMLTFDRSDNEEELSTSKYDANIGFSFDGNRRSGVNKGLGSDNSSDDTDSEEIYNNKKGDVELNASSKKFGITDELTGQFSLKHTKPYLDSDQIDQESSNFESGNGLNFGTLTGGFRHKGYKLPPYTRSLNDDSSSSKQQKSISSGSPTKKENAKVSSKLSSAAPFASSESDVDIMKEEVPQQTFRSSQKGYREKVDRNLNSRRHFASFDSEMDHSKQELPQRTSIRNQEKKVNRKSSSGSPFTSFDSRIDNSKEDILQTLSGKQEAFNEKEDTKVSKNLSSRAPVASFGSDFDSSKDEQLRQQTSSHTEESYNQTKDRNLTRKFNSRAPISYFDSGEADSDEDIPKEPLPSRGRSSSGFSRRTKASPSNSETSSQSKHTVVSESTATSDYGTERKPSSFNISTKTPRKPSSQMENSQRSKSEGILASKPAEDLKISLSKESSKSGGIESFKKPSLSGETPSREDSLKKATHVHPKLPDYDTLSAHLQALRMNRQ